MSLENERFCIWLNEAGHPTIDSLSALAEKVTFGGYVPCLIGTKKEISRLCKRMLKKPCLIEKYIKTLPE